MKTSQDPRHIKRQHTVQELFKIQFHNQPISPRAEEVLKNKDVIDAKIQEAAPEFPIDKINRVDLSILRLAVFELLIEKKEPVNVIIDEAVELGKEFGGEASPSFINGALGNIINHERPSKDQ
ncbi:MAG: transcription antitermination protein NusB [Candidatus Levybacteria bacterium]|nr:transcription antitermination protein NusB [Candidatus Levybacteria bacterium]